MCHFEVLFLLFGEPNGKILVFGTSDASGQLLWNLAYVQLISLHLITSHIPHKYCDFEYKFYMYCGPKITVKNRLLA